jgi:lipid-binding SYLF domain-containing protein
LRELTIRGDGVRRAIDGNFCRCRATNPTARQRRAAEECPVQEGPADAGQRAKHVHCCPARVAPGRQLILRRATAPTPAADARVYSVKVTGITTLQATHRIMKRIVATCLSLLLAVVLVLPTQAEADSRTDQRLQHSQRVFEAFSDLTEQSIPSWLLDRAYGIVVVPGVVKVALTIGGRGGKGVMSVRNPDGTWSAPAFVNLGGVNFGFQVGVQSTDVILVLMSRESVEGIAGGKVTLGADASVAAGPLGRSSAAATDATLSAQVLSYSRSSGLFVGVALDGTVIAIDKSANESAYGISGVLASQILEGEITNVPPAAQEFTAALTRATKAPSAKSAPAAPETHTAPAVTPVPANEPAKTYPMEDPNPGAVVSPTGQVTPVPPIPQ